MTTEQAERRSNDPVSLVQRAVRKRRAKKEGITRPETPGRRGFTGAGRGQSFMLQSPREYRATTMQVCGLWPWIGGSSTPFEGAPMGLSLETGHPLGCDPIAWFRAGIINNPSVFILGLPGYGKSTTIRHMLLGMNGAGVIPIVPGDLKPDYVDLIVNMGGQVIVLAPGRGHLNILDPGDVTRIANMLPEREREQLLVDAHSRKLQMVSALITILRKGPVRELEESILDQALWILEDEHEGVPVVGDLLDLIRSRPQGLRDVALDRGDETRYRDATDDLVASLMSLNGTGRFGDMFSKPTSAELSMDRPAVFDISGISDTQRDVQAAALLACWSATFAAVDAAHALADAGLAENRNYFIPIDEMWRALRSGPDMVDRIDSLTRLNRNEGVGQAMITHTMSDLDALPTEDERAKARGFVERAGMVLCGALPRSEMKKLNQAVPLSEIEAQTLMSWSDPGSWSRVRHARAQTAGGTKPRLAPGVGKFMIKVGGRPGITFRTQLTASEIELNDTNRRWSKTGEAVDVSSPNEVTNAILDEVAPVEGATP